MVTLLRVSLFCMVRWSYRWPIQGGSFGFCGCWLWPFWCHHQSCQVCNLFFTKDSSFLFVLRILVLRRISLSFNDLCRAVEQHLQTFSHRERKKVRKLVSTSIFSDLIRNWIPWRISFPCFGFCADARYVELVRLVHMGCLLHQCHGQWRQARSSKVLMSLSYSKPHMHSFFFFFCKAAT